MVVAKEERMSFARSWVVMMAAVVVSGNESLPGAETFHAFTSTDGKTVMAKLVKVAGQDVVILTDSGRSFTLPASRFSPEDQTYIKEWAVAQEKQYVPKLEAFFGTGKSDAKDGTDYDNRSQTLRPSLRIENRDGSFSVQNAKGVLFIFGKSAVDSSLVRVLSKQTFPLTVGPLQKAFWEGNPIKVGYDTNYAAKFGFKYNGYLLVVENASGKIICVEGSTSFTGKAEAALQLEEGDTADRNLRKTVSPFP